MLLPTQLHALLRMVGWLIPGGVGRVWTRKAVLGSTPGHPLHCSTNSTLNTPTDLDLSPMAAPKELSLTKVSPWRGELLIILSSIQTWLLRTLPPSITNELHLTLFTSLPPAPICSHSCAAFFCVHSLSSYIFCVFILWFLIFALFPHFALFAL